MAYLKPISAVLVLAIMAITPSAAALAAPLPTLLVPHPVVRFTPNAVGSERYVSAATSTAYASYTVMYDVTAVGANLYMPATAGTDQKSGAVYTVNGTPAFSGAQVGTLTSSATRSGNFYVIPLGQPQTFKLNVSLYTSVPGSYAVELTKANFATSPAGPLQTATVARFVGDTAFVTNSVQIVSVPVPAPLASAHLDGITVSTATSTVVLSGSATGVTSLTVIIYSATDQDNWVYRNNAIPVINGRWTVPLQLSPGNYSFEVHRSSSTPGSATLLTFGDFIISAQNGTTSPVSTSTEATTTSSTTTTSAAIR